MKYLFLCSLLLLGACASTLADKTIVGNHAVEGQVLDSRTARPIVSALVVLTVPEGNTWSLPSSYLVGYAYTDTEGKFLIQAHPHAIDDLRRNNAPFSIDVYHSDYKQAVDFISQSKHAPHPVTVKMEKGYNGDLVAGISGDGCAYNNPGICKLVKDYLGL